MPSARGNGWSDVRNALNHVPGLESDAVNDIVDYAKAKVHASRPDGDPRATESVSVPDATPTPLHDTTDLDTSPEQADWRPPAAMNPWSRAFDGDSLPDEPYMGSNKRPKQLGDILPYPDATQAPDCDAAPAYQPSMGV